MALLVYLGVMAYLGRGYFIEGDYTYYFGVIGVSLVIIVVLYYVLRMRDRIRQERDKLIENSYKDKERTDDKKVED